MSIIRNAVLHVPATAQPLARVDMAGGYREQYTPDGFALFDNVRLRFTLDPQPGQNGPLFDTADTNHVPSIMPLSGHVGEGDGIVIEGVYFSYWARLEQHQVTVPPGAYALKIIMRINQQIRGDGIEPDSLWWRYVYIIDGVEYKQMWLSQEAWGQKSESIQYVYAPREAFIAVAVEFWQRWGNTEGRGLELYNFDFVPVPIDEPNRYFDLETHQLVTGHIDNPPAPPNPIPPTFPWTFVLVLLGVLGAVIAGGALVFYLLNRTATSLGAITMDESLIELWNQLSNIPIFAAVAFGLPVIYYLMELWKRRIDPLIPTPHKRILRFFMKPTPVGLFLALVFVLSASFYLAGTLEQGAAFKRVFEILTDFVNVFGKYFLGTLVVQIAGSRSYDALRARKSAGFNAPPIKRS